MLHNFWQSYSSSRLKLGRLYKIALPQLLPQLHHYQNLNLQLSEQEVSNARVARDNTAFQAISM